jgi:KDO2-lipid IV(A) lauroyltransferase
VRGHLVSWLLHRVLNRLAADTACRIGGGLGVIAWRLGIRRRVAQRQMEAVLGLRGRVRGRILRRSYATMGASFLELWTVGGPDGPERHVEILDPHWSDRLAGAGGVIFATPHLGSWDMAAHAWAARHGSITAYAKEQHDPEVDAATNRRRADLGIRILLAHRGDRTAAVKALRLLRDGGALGLLADQRPSRGEGAEADFLGHRTLVQAGPAFFARRSGAALVPGFAIRRRAGRCVVWVGRPLTGADENDLRQKACDAMAACIAAFPGQYFWQHRRLRGEPRTDRATDWRTGLAWFR